MEELTGKDCEPAVLGFLAGEPIGKVHEVRVWCRYCAAWHIHGVEPWASAGTVASRLAHCFAPDSPYKESGYRITVARSRYEDVRGQVRSATTRQQLLLAEGQSTPAIERLKKQPAPSDRSRKGAGTVLKS